MTTTISADNGTVSGSAGLKSTADSSGILALQTGANTTAVTIDASQNVKFSNNISVSNATGRSICCTNIKLGSEASAIWNRNQCAIG